MSLPNINLLNDPYYDDAYLSLYLKNDDELFLFTYKEKDKLLINKSIKRRITHIGTVTVSGDYYDLESAYGYGGFYTNTTDKSFIQKAMQAYIQKCSSEQIIAEFIRLHPFNTFSEQHHSFFDFLSCDRETVFIDLDDDYLSISNRYTPSLRRNIKKASTYNLTYKKEDIDTDTIQQFYELYHQTMQKNEADPFYFFDLSYFQRLFQIPNIELHSVSYKKKIICMVIIFNSNKIISYHLGATDPLYYSLNPNPFIFDCIVQQYANTNKILYLGGGRSSQKDDSLLRFKSKFAKTKKPFYIGGKIYNHKIYHKYIQLWSSQSDSDMQYFLKYRLNTKKE